MNNESNKKFSTPDLLKDLKTPTKTTTSKKFNSNDLKRSKEIISKITPKKEISLKGPNKLAYKNRTTKK